MHTRPSQFCSTVTGFQANLFGVLKVRKIHTRQTDTVPGVQIEEVSCAALSGARTLLAYLLLYRQQLHSRVVLA